MTDELDCSDGAKMLIERMKEYPQEFRGGSARWSMVIHQVLQVRRGGVENNIMMSKRDMNALWDAFERHVMETALAEHVITRMMEPELERKKVQVTRPAPLTSRQMTEESLKVLQAEFEKAYRESDYHRYAELVAEYEYQNDKLKYKTAFEQAKAEQLRYSPTDKYDILDRKPWI